MALNNDWVIINLGGTGQPRDGDPRVSYGIYDSNEGTVNHHRVEYDILATQEKMRKHGLPQLLIERLAHGR